MLLTDKANQYIDRMQPWTLSKDKKNTELVQSVCTTALNLFRLLAIMLSPVIPNLSQRIYTFLRIELPLWKDMSNLLLDHEISTYKTLLKRIEKKKIEEIILESKES